ncbi:hypothetical protein BH10ACI1_BH10ACI1_04450 [soil metagenome]
MEWLGEIWNWLLRFWETLTWSRIIFGVLILVVSFAFSFFVIGVVLVRIPQNYFHSDYENNFLQGKHQVLRWSGIILKNIVGIIVIFLGILMAIPGVPGPGVLTILIGLIMIDIPGKRYLESLIIKRPMILSAANDLRARYQKPPLLLD